MDNDADYGIDYSEGIDNKNRRITQSRSHHFMCRLWFYDVSIIETSQSQPAITAELIKSRNVSLIRERQLLQSVLGEVQMS